MQKNTKIDQLVPGITYDIRSRVGNPPREGVFIGYVLIHGQKQAKFKLPNVPGIPDYTDYFSPRAWYFMGKDVKGGRRTRKRTQRKRKTLRRRR
jgi:hypothetical protein